jgi:hypothetical protein
VIQYQEPIDWTPSWWVSRRLGVSAPAGGALLFDWSNYTASEQFCQA